MKYFMLLILIIAVTVVSVAQTGGLIRDLTNETGLRQNVHNALAIGTVVTGAFDTTGTSKFVRVWGVTTSSIVTAHPYGTADADSMSALYAYVKGNDSVYVTRVGALLETQLKFAVIVHKF